MHGLFLGGFTVETHGSRDGGRFDAILMETPREVRIDAGRVTRVRYGESLGKAIALFYLKNYSKKSHYSITGTKHYKIH